MNINKWGWLRPVIGASQAATSAKPRGHGRPKAAGAKAVAEQLEDRTLLSTSYLLDTIYGFSPPSGASPQAAPAVDPSGNLFGTTSRGGAAGYGTVFKIIRGATAVTTVSSFNNANGSYPYAGVTLDSSGNLFGTTSQGGAGGFGTVFEIVHGTTVITTLASFNNANGANPQAGVTLDSNGNLFGTTYYGGTGSYGSVFEIVHGTTAITTVASFNNANGANPQGGLTLDSSGNLFGTTSQGGAGGKGTVFEIVQGTTAITTLASFTNSNGAYPQAGLTLDSSGNLFGTTYRGGTSGLGTVFEIVQGTSTIATLASFNNANGANPEARVTLDASGNLFGTTYYGGPGDFGTVFEIVHGTTAITTIASFDDANGANPYAGLTLDSNGNLFGATNGGGPGGYGTVFELSPMSPTLSFTKPPFSGTAGSTLNGGTGVQVSVLYPWGNLDPADSSAVTLTLNGGTFAGGGTTATAAVINGVATFANLVINTTGTYSLTASDGTYTSVGSGIFTISAAAPVKLAFVQQPTGVGAGTAINPAVTVAVRDVYGNTVVSNTSAVTLTLVNGVFSTGGNSLTVNAVKGIATFSNLIVNNAGSYTITASDSSLTSATSGSFTIYSFDYLHTFNLPNGTYPYAGVTLDSSGNLFGTTYGGGLGYGTVFEIVHGTTAITTLAGFDNANGANPYGGVTLDSSGNLFGTTYQGGAGGRDVGKGTVFEIVHGSATITTRGIFNGTNGANPYGGVTFDSSGNLFGTASQGGASGKGTIFEIVHGTNSISAVASFNDTNGANPHAGVTLDSNGNLFGTTYQGGAAGYGTVYEIVRGTTVITTLASFNNDNGAHPETDLALDSSGNMFGTTANGGATGAGTVFEIVHGTTTITTLASFNDANSANFNGGVTVDSSGNLFGTTFYGGTDAAGIIFEIVHGSATITTLANFDNTNGANPRAGLTPDSSGNLFGTTSQGGADGVGTIFEIVHDSTVITTLVNLSDTIGVLPYSGLTLDAGGNLFGTTYQGGASGNGTVYEIVHGTNAITTLASFNNANGANPCSDITFDSSGNLFGTTDNGGASDYGTVFEIVHGTNAITTLASFNNPIANGAHRFAKVTFDSSGNLFGTTDQGGAGGKGMVFEIVHGTNAITTVASFNGTNGANPRSSVTFDSSGNLFGTTFFGGAGGYGTVFEIVHGTSTITPLASFNNANGAYPYAGLTFDPSGNLFGSTYQGGADARGTVFEIVRGTNTITTLASFNNANGSYPQDDVTIDSSGNLFGTAFIGGTGDYGTVFEIVHGTTTIATLANFTIATGADPLSGLTLDSNGNLFGTCNFGGPGGYGTVFELSPTPPILSFTTPLASATTGSALNGATGVQVGVLHSSGNVYTADSSTVTLTLTGGTFADGSTTTTAATVNGVATFTNLVINTAGSYTLTATDNSLTSTASASFVVTPPGIAVVATGGNDSIYLRKDANGTHVDEWLNSSTPGNGTPTTTYLLTGAASLIIDGGGGNDQVTIDQSNGDLLEATNGISSVGGPIGVKIIGTNSNDSLSLDGSSKSITWNTGASAKTLYFAGVSSVEYQDTGGIDNVSVTGSIPLTFDMGPSGATLTVASGSNATGNFGSSSGDLTINGNGNTSLVFGTGNPTFQFVTTPVNPMPATGTITGVVFNDSNGDGKRESGDKPLAGRKLYIDSNHNGKLDKGEPTAVTDAAGVYHFAGLAAGTYRVREVVPAGYRASSPAAGYLDMTVAGGKTASGKNFGQTREAMISGIVFHDADGDGKRESSEAKLAGWVVYLDANNNGKLDKGERSVTTSSDGKYSFVVPAGKYRLRTVGKKGSLPTAASASTFIVTMFDGQTVTKDESR